MSITRLPSGSAGQAIRSPAHTALLSPIGEFAALARLSPRALRLYDRQGLLAPAAVDPDTGHRRYHPVQVERARRIRLLRAADMPLRDVAAALDAGDEAGALHAFAERLEADHARRLAAVGAARDALEAAPFAACGARLRELPDRDELTVLHTVTAGELAGAVRATIGELMEAGAAPAGAPFTRFLTPVNGDRPGRVEVGLPVRGAPSQPPPGARLRRRLATTAACIRLTGEDARPPRVLQAYEALPAWAAARGLRTAAAPFEEYLDAGGDELEVCWPVR